MKSSNILVTSCIVLLCGCGKPVDSNRVQKTNTQSISEKNDAIIVKKSQEETETTNTYTKITIQTADYEEIANKITAIEAKRELDEKLAEYAAFMKKKKPFQGTVKLERITCSSLTGPPIPGRILTDDDVACLCSNNEKKISMNLHELIAASMGYAPEGGKKATVEDGEALLRYLMQYGKPEVQAEAKSILAAYITQTVGRQDEALGIFNEAITEMKAADMDIKEIIGAEVDRVSVYIYKDDPEGMEEVSDVFYKKYKDTESKEYFWDKMMELYWIRTKTWRGVDDAYALKLCREAMEIDNEYAEKACERWGIKDMHDYIKKTVTLNNKREEQ